MPTISPTSSSTASAGATALVPSVGGSTTLTQKDFLNLLIAQMKAQDPLNPQTNTEMAAQMAQFTSLQQASTMSENIATMLKQQQAVQANGLLGGTVTVQVNKDTTATGVVQAVQMEGSTPKIVVNNRPYDLSQVLMIAPTQVSSTPVVPASFFASTLPAQAVDYQTTP